jgi:hypothetical protein
MFFRKAKSGVPLMIEILALVSNTCLSDEVRGHRYFLRLIDAISDVGVVGKSIMDLQNETEGNKENLVVIKVLHGRSPEFCIRECEKMIWDQTLEVIRHAKLLLQIFPNDREALPNYLKHCFNLINNYFIESNSTTIQKTTTTIKLPEFKDNEEQSNYIFHKLLARK